MAGWTFLKSCYTILSDWESCKLIDSSNSSYGNFIVIKEEMMRMTKYLIFGDACTSSDKRTEIYAGFAIL